MSENKLQFGDYCQIEMKRYGVANEFYIHKVVNTHRSNSWVDVPVKSPAKEVVHDHMEDVVSCIVEGIQETEVLRYRASDVKKRPSTTETPSLPVEPDQRFLVESCLNWVAKTCHVEDGQFYYQCFKHDRDNKISTLDATAIYLGTPYSEPKALPVEEVQDSPKMSDELAARADVAAIEYGETNGQNVCREEVDYDNSADLTEAFLAGQNWIYGMVQQHLSNLREGLAEARNDFAVYKEWYERVKEQLIFERQLVKRQEETIRKLTEQIEKKLLEANTFRTLLEDIQNQFQYQNSEGFIEDGLYSELMKVEKILKENKED